MSDSELEGCVAAALMVVFVTALAALFAWVASTAITTLGYPVGFWPCFGVIVVLRFVLSAASGGCGVPGGRR